MKKKSKVHVVACRIPDELFLDLHKQADYMERPISFLIRKAIQLYLKELPPLVPIHEWMLENPGQKDGIEER